MKTKKILLIITLILGSFILTGCWNYVGLNEMTIVTGFAVDKTKDNKYYHTTFEIVDMIESNKQVGIRTKVIESEGETIFKAIRNAKKRITNKLYFANAQIIIISEDIAKKEGINNVLNWFLRDAEVRETMNVVIAKDSSAKDIISIKGLGNSITSYEISEIIKRDNDVTSSTSDTQLYNTYNVLNGHGLSLVLPTLHIVKNDDEEAIEADGIAIFDKDRLIGYLNATQAEPYLLAIGKSRGGIITISDNNTNKPDISLEISEVNEKKSYTYNQKKIKFKIDLELKVYLGEDMKEKGVLKEKDIAELEAQANKQINKDVGKVINKIQTEFNTDILGFGQYIYRHDPHLYKKLEKEWKSLFKDIEVKVNSKVTIVNTAFMK